MDGLISLLIIIGIAAISSSNKKKKARKKAAERSRGFKSAAEAMRREAPPLSREDWIAYVQKKSAQGMKTAAKTPEPAMEEAKPDGTKIAPAAPMVQIIEDAPMRSKNPAPVLFMENDAPEGSISTQGENPEEHARHRQRILAEEEEIRREHEEIQEVRSMNLQKLRTAVIMSEVLGKPVSLRGRRTL